MSCFALVTITDLGGGNAVNLHNVNGPLPVPIPQATYEMQLVPMRQGSGGPGYRAVQLLGALERNTDWEFSCEYVTPEQFSALQTKYYRQPAEPVRLTADGGNTWYVVVFRSISARHNEWTTDRIAIDLKFATLKKL